MSIPDGYYIDLSRIPTMPWKETCRHFWCMRRLKREIEKSKSERNRRRREADEKTLLGIRNLVIQGNLRLVISIIKNFKNPNLYDELVAEGNFGLIDAVDRFDVSLGWRFSTYAYRSIKNRMLNVLNGDNLMVGRGAGQRVNLLARARRELNTMGNFRPSTQDISDYLNEFGPKTSRGKWTIKNVGTIQLAERGKYPVSLDDSDDEHSPVRGIIGRESEVGVMDDAQLILDIIELHLSRRHREVVQMRFFEHLTLTEVGVEIGVTRERVRQIEAQALTRVRQIIDAGRGMVIPAQTLLGYDISGCETTLCLYAPGNWRFLPRAKTVDPGQNRDKPKESRPEAAPLPTISEHLQTGSRVSCLV